MKTNEETNELVEQAIRHVTGAIDCEAPEAPAEAVDTLMCMPPEAIVRTLLHLRDHASGSLKDLLGALLSMAEATISGLNCSLGHYRRWLESCEKSLGIAQAHREALVHEVLNLRALSAEEKRLRDDQSAIIDALGLPRSTHLSSVLDHIAHLKDQQPQ